jgi:hypothetical protein
MMVVYYNIILVDDTVGPLVGRIKNSQCSSCTQLQKSNQNQNPATSKMIHHKRSDRGRLPKDCALIEQNGREL